MSNRASRAHVPRIMADGSTGVNKPRKRSLLKISVSSNGSRSGRRQSDIDMVDDMADAPPQDNELPIFSQGDASAVGTDPDPMLSLQEKYESPTEVQGAPPQDEESEPVASPPTSVYFASNPNSRRGEGRRMLALNVHPVALSLHHVALNVCPMSDRFSKWRMRTPIRRRKSHRPLGGVPCAAPNSTKHVRLDTDTRCPRNGRENIPTSGVECSPVASSPELGLHIRPALSPRLTRWDAVARAGSFKTGSFKNKQASMRTRIPRQMSSGLLSKPNESRTTSPSTMILDEEDSAQPKSRQVSAKSKSRRHSQQSKSRRGSSRAAADLAAAGGDSCDDEDAQDGPREDDSEPARPTRAPAEDEGEGQHTHSTTIKRALIDNDEQP
eukprot:33531-Pyramimonas_sp.AAC.2